MKTRSNTKNFKLTLIRHSTATPIGEIAQDQLTVDTDFDRPLTADGLEKAVQLGKSLLKQPVQIDTIISSPALRTKTTAHTLVKQLSLSTQSLTYDADLYNASANAILSVIQASPNKQYTGHEVQSLAVIGHNPGISDVISLLIGTDSRQMIAPCTAVTILLPINDWAAVCPGIGTECFRWAPID